MQLFSMAEFFIYCPKSFESQMLAARRDELKGEVFKFRGLAFLHISNLLRKNDLIGVYAPNENSMNLLGRIDLQIRGRQLTM